MKRVILAAAVAALAVQYGTTGVVDARQPTPPLQFFKNYFVTGDYAIGGVGVNGNGKGTINISGVPADSDVVAAFLYWQVVDKNNVGAEAGGLGVTFRGHQLENEDGAFSKLLIPGGTPACSSGGGGASGSGITYTYRADVLRYLAVAEPPPAGNGQTIANGPHEVSLPNGQGLDALGASLLLVFREWALDTPLSAVVIMDGASTLNSASQTLGLNIGGFYDASTSAKLSVIVGGGQTNPAETLKYNGAIIQTNPFASARAAQWDNPTFNLTANPNLQTVNVTIDQGPASSTWGCLTLAAEVYRTTVKDGDGDGLLDRLETAGQYPISDPYGRPLPNLPAMGATPTVKDVFIETGYFDSDFDNNGTLDDLFYGDPTNLANKRNAHTHLPPPESLKLMGDAFALKGIKVHFDMGPNYAAGVDVADVADQYLVPAAEARGGDRMSESITVCAPTPDPVTGLSSVWDCQFRYHPGTVGWKTGFQFLRDQLLNPATPPTPLPPDWVDPCELPGSTCERRFDAVRKHSFHYAMFTHATGIAKSWAACVQAPVPPSTTPTYHYDDDNGHCAPGQTLNPDFFTPKTTSGVADYPGGDLQISLGGFLDLSARPVGTPFMIASTLMHEFGHNAERRHGGDPLDQNCKPTYLSVMNYLYQLRGLLDDFGTPHLDFSGGGGLTVSEAPPTGLAGQPYRLGWYAPLGTSYLFNHVAQAKSFCNGAPYPTGTTPMVRVDAPTAAGAIDWDANNTAGQLYPQQDVNFNGYLDDDNLAGSLPPLTDSDDWSKLRLNQVAIRRNVGVHYRIPGTLEIAIGPSSTDLGKTEGGKTEGGKTEGGKTEGGKTEGGAGWSDLGKTEGGVVFGKTEGGSGDDGRGLFGGGDTFQNHPFNPSGEIDSFYDVNRPPPYEFKACVIGDCSVQGAPTTPFHRVWVTFKPVGDATSYVVYRVSGTTLTQGQTWTQVASLPAVLGQQQYSTVDPFVLNQGQQVVYFAVSVFPSGVSEPSNWIPIVGKNDPPVARNDSYSTNANTTLVVPAATGVLANDGDPDSPVSPTAVKLTNPAHGTVSAFGSDGSFTYVPSAGYSGPDSFTYRATFGTTQLTATVNITVNQVVPYTFVNLQNAPPPASKTLNVGSVLPMEWQYKSGATVVDSGQLTFTVRMAGPLPGGTLTNADPGSSAFRYAASTKSWSFNLQTKQVNGQNLPAGLYNVTITPSSLAYATATFQVRLK